MGQTIGAVAFEVQPGAADLLEQAVTIFRTMQEPAGAEAYAVLKAKIPALHFMSIMVFRDPHYDPLFVLEVNFDGDAIPFWTSVADAIGPCLIDMLAHCAPPRAAAARNRFHGVLQTGRGLAEMLQVSCVCPTASHCGNRGLTRSQILDEAALFAKLQTEIDTRDTEYRSKDPVEIHRLARERLRGDFPWLDEASRPRIPWPERLRDLWKLAVFATGLFAILALPGTVAALILPAWLVAALGAAAALAFLPRVPDLRRLVPPGAAQFAVLTGIVLACTVSAMIWLGALALASYLPAVILAGAVAGPAVLLLVLIWLRRLETADSSSTAPILNPDQARSLAEREDHTDDVYQNHMGSLVLVKPGGLRSLLLRAGHRALFLALRVVSRDGYLSDMRTVHFAHWALLNNKSRLLFMSNFDGTWDSYLDDFIEKAHQGTTLAWTNCVGSPAAAFLALDGVTKGRQFKLWARRSMAANLFWFSAYPTLTVNQIERNHAVAEGLRAATLDSGRAAQWIRSL